MSDHEVTAAAGHAAQAAQVAQKLKRETYDSVQALVLLSIADSLNRIAVSLESRQ